MNSSVSPHLAFIRLSAATGMAEKSWAARPKSASMRVDVLRPNAINGAGGYRA
jgi:hypothetical protein